MNKTVCANIESKDKNQQTPLQIASMNSKTDVVKYLVSKGANKNAKYKYGKTQIDNYENSSNEGAHFS